MDSSALLDDQVDPTETHQHTTRGAIAPVTPAATAATAATTTAAPGGRPGLGLPQGSGSSIGDRSHRSAFSTPPPPATAGGHHVGQPTKMSAAAPNSGTEIHTVGRAAGKDAIDPSDSPSNAEPLAGSANSRAIALLTVFATLGGLLFGYDTGVVSGALLLIQKEFNLTDTEQEVVVAATVGAAIVGAALGGRAGDKFGRRPVIMVSAAVFTVGAGLLAASTGYGMLVIGRIVVGVAIGLSSMTIPVYIAEAAPPQYRGVLVSANTLCVTGGQFVAALIDGAFSSTPGGWRYMLGIGGIPAILQVIGFIFLPESPRWLVMQGARARAAQVLGWIRAWPSDSPQLQDELERIEASFDDGPTMSFKQIISQRSIRRALVLGCMLQALQQMAGINTVMYYSGTILTLAGFSDASEAIWLTALVASANFLFTILGLFLVDRLGRRLLTIFSLAAVVLALGMLSAAFWVQAIYAPVLHTPPVDLASVCTTASTCLQCSTMGHCGFCHAPASNGTWGYCVPGNETGPATAASLAVCGMKLPIDAAHTASNWFWDMCPSAHNTGWLAVLALMLYLAFFAPGMGPMPWTINSEIYPLAARSTCVSITTAVNWVLNFVVAMTFLTLANALTPHGVFLLYAAIALGGVVYLGVALPETRGKSLEQVELLFMDKEEARQHLLAREEHGQATTHSEAEMSRA